MEVITQLTQAQIDRFPEFVQKWMGIGLCTEPANRPEAERGIRLAYQLAGIEPPKQIVWCGSPLAQWLARTIVFNLKDSASVWESVGESVRASVGVSVRASVGVSVRASVGDSVGDSVWESVRESVYGQHDASWLGFYDYFRIVFGLEKETQKLAGLWTVAKNAGWWLPHKNICWVSERHNVLNRDDRGRLHCVDGPAISYPDNWSIFSVHGVRVDEAVVLHGETQTMKEIRDEKNVEVRRVRIERCAGKKSTSADGWRRYLTETKAKVLHKRRNDIEATQEALFQQDGSRVLIATCKTGRLFAMEVDPSCETCEQAQNYLAGSGSSPLPEPISIGRS